MASPWNLPNSFRRIPESPLPARQQGVHTISRSSSHVRLIRIVSGGQTGVDRAALDAAMQAGLEVGGWCPRDRRAEDGSVPLKYPLKETAARTYAVRTEWNVRDSDGTLVLVLNEITSGTRLTVNAAQAHDKPLKIEYLQDGAPVGLLREENSLPDQVNSVVDWITRHRIQVLNVAGPRGSSSKDLYPRALSFMVAVLEQWANRSTDPVTRATGKRRKP
jgi:hypothetical protein